MTGFGRGAATVGAYRVEAEISTVNRKQFDCAVSLPQGFAALEEDCRREARSRISRGHVQVALRIFTDSASSASSAPATPVPPALAAAMSRLRALSAAAGIAFAPTLSDLLAVPGILDSLDPAPDPDQARPAALAALAAALDSLSSMRAREGAALRADLDGRLERLLKIREHIAERAPLVPAAHRDAMRRRVAELGSPLPPDDPSLAREIALLADKCDITEELTRLAAHVAHARALLEGPEPAGRKLDFLSQEMNRECNTIGSKSPDADISARVVEAKALVETFREQVQNVE